MEGPVDVPDGSALAGALFDTNANQFSEFADEEPQLVHAACGQPPATTEFRLADPTGADQMVPADFEGSVSAVAANASNDAWAATTDGRWPYCFCGGQEIAGPLAPHLYQWTDGQPPDAPAGDDNEARPSVFTLDPPVYVVGSPTVIVTPVVVTTTQTKGKTKKRKLPPPIYDVHDKLQRTGTGIYVLYLTFKLRRPVTIGLEGLRGGKVVASTGLKRFRGHRGELALKLDRNHWPTKLRLVTPKKK